jgi:hypothetical protein
MIDQLKSIGIEKGKPFNPDPKTQEPSSNLSEQQAGADLNAKIFHNLRSPHLLSSDQQE